MKLENRLIIERDLFIMGGLRKSILELLLKLLYKVEESLWKCLKVVLVFLFIFNFDSIFEEFIFEYKVYRINICWIFF